jgi:glutaredoxin
MKQIDSEFADRALPEKEKTEFEDLQTEKKELVRTIEELETRTAWITESAEKPESREAGAKFYTRPERVRGEDVHDLSTVRASDNPTKELRDRAKTVVERMQFPQLGSDWRRASTARIARPRSSGWLQSTTQTTTRWVSCRVGF